MLKNGLLGFTFMLTGLLLVFLGPNLYVMIAGGALIVISTIFFTLFKVEMIRKTLEFTEKKRLEKLKNKI